MFVPKVWFDEQFLYHTFHDLVDFPFDYNTWDLQVGRITKVEQHETTLYVLGTERNVIIVNLGLDPVKVLHEYSHEIPTWMKEDFNRFLKGG